MRVLGRASWRIQSDMPHDLHFALFVRDAAGLTGGPPARWTPPTALDARLEVPDLRELADGPQRDLAARQWPDWWDWVIDAPSPFAWTTPTRPRLREDIPADVDQRLHTLLGGLAPAPELRAIVARCAALGAAWEERRKRLIAEFMRPAHAAMHEIGTELQRRTDAAAMEPPDVSIDFAMAAGDGAILHDGGRVIVWGAALAEPVTRDKILDHLGAT